MEQNPLKELGRLGQSVWLDYISRELISGGGLRRLIDEDGLCGMTSNPAIFEKAINGSSVYEADIRALAQRGKDVQAIYEELALGDVRAAAEVFAPVHHSSGGLDGYVSLEVDPRLAHDAAGTIAEGRRLWAALDRPNVFVKVPATKEGIAAIRALIAEGININVTLLFGIPRYREVIEAYLGGLEERKAAGKPVGSVRSVASFFVSRIDTLVDQMLEGMIAAGGPEKELAASLRGQVAIDSAKVAYLIWKEAFKGQRFGRLGAQTQRLLWASTSTKNPAYSPVKYVEALIGPETVNTMPLETIEAYRAQGQPRSRLELDQAEAGWALRRLAELGIGIDEVTQKLEDEGVDKFIKPFAALLGSIEKAAARAAHPVA
ncbi:MAG TPA: transaldolase [Rectinemataceae bacterium]|nr:transaldolase [Rectinemataceae bacterium]